MFGLDCSLRKHSRWRHTVRKWVVSGRTREEKLSEHMSVKWWTSRKPMAVQLRVAVLFRIVLTPFLRRRHVLQPLLLPGTPTIVTELSGEELAQEDT